MPKRPSRVQHPSSPGSVGAASVDEKRSTTFSSNGGAATEPREATALHLHADELNGAQNGNSSKGPCQCWPIELDQFLRKAAKADTSHERSSIALIRQAHPHLSKTVIWERIVYLGLTVESAPRMKNMTGRTWRTRSFVLSTESAMGNRMPLSTRS